MTTLAQPNFLPFHRPSLDEREIAAVVDVMRSGWLTTGPKAHEFEKKFAEFVGVRYALAVNSCTAALHLALDAIGLKSGDEVLLPTLTFAATAEVVTYFGAKPVLVDSEPEYFTLNTDNLSSRLTPRTKALIPVHFAGHPCKMDDIVEFARRNGLAVVEDAAHAFPAKYKGRNIGTLSALTAFSFYATKTITTGEGGMIVTDDQDLAARMALMRLHGMSKDAWNRYHQHGSWRYDVVAPGFKYNLTDLQAAIGLVQLEKAESMILGRARIAERYTEGFQDLLGFQVPRVSDDVQHAWHLYVLVISPETLCIDRDEVIEELGKRGIGCSVHFIPLHLLSYYKQTWGYVRGQFPVAEDYFKRCISLPIYSTMTDAEVDRVVKAVRDVSRRFRNVSRATVA
jgi:dTDP-4-amino-4,6-dideoxygalactose transaminase